MVAQECSNQSDKRLEVGSLMWQKIRGEVTFYMLFDKYSKKKVVASDRPLKRMRSPTHQERPSLPPRKATRYRGESS
jgi:hypothetical protein